MLFRPPYNAAFEIDEPISPSTKTTFAQWFGDERMTIIRTVVFIMLSQYVAQGRFTEPGMYLIRVRRQGLWIQGRLFKFPPASNINTIAIFLKHAGIEIEGLTNATTINARFN